MSRQEGPWTHMGHYIHPNPHDMCLFEQLQEPNIFAFCRSETSISCIILNIEFLCFQSLKNVGDILLMVQKSG